MQPLSFHPIAYINGVSYINQFFLNDIYSHPDRFGGVVSDTYTTDCSWDEITKRLGTPELVQADQHEYQGLWYRNVGGSVVWVTLHARQCDLHVGAFGLSAAQSMVDDVKQMIPPADTSNLIKRIPLDLWYNTIQGPRTVNKLIDVPDWSDIKDNYRPQTKDALEDLMAQRPETGKIILWHGPPGTGKTYALRALGYEWRDWCSLHYVVDPEDLFGDSSSYLMQFLMDDSGGGMKMAEGTAEPKEHWRLLVLEDTGELLQADAKKEVGQALSRLLNVTDGLIGQGLKLFILVTTNEELGKMHPAVSRPGRNAATIHFGPFMKYEAADWITAHGHSTDLAETQSSWTLAELYALGHEPITNEPKRHTGFALPAHR